MAKNITRAMPKESQEFFGPKGLQQAMNKEKMWAHLT